MPKRRKKLADVVYSWAFHPEDGGGRVLTLAASLSVLFISPVWACGTIMILVSGRDESLSVFNVGSVAFLLVTFLGGLFAARRVHRINVKFEDDKRHVELSAGADNPVASAADERVREALKSLDFDSNDRRQIEPPALTGEIPTFRSDGHEA